MIFYRLSLSAYQYRRVCFREDVYCRDETREKQRLRLERKEEVVFVDFIDVEGRSSE